MPSERRQRDAFAAELASWPTIAPGPTALNRRLGKQGKLNALGWSKLRAELLLEAGFVKAPSGRWVLPEEAARQIAVEEMVKAGITRAEAEEASHKALEMLT